MMRENKFKQIYSQLVSDIQKGNIQPNSFLPSEHELVEQFQTSRETIRKALKLLSEHGYIQKMQGKGSLVLDVKRMDFPVSGLVSFKELAVKMGKETITYVEHFSETVPSKEIAEQLKLKADELIWEIVRVREIDGERIIVDKDFINKTYIPSLTKTICEQSIYEYIENDLGLTISFARKEFTVEEPTNEDQRYLDLEGHCNIVVVKNYVYLEDASLFQFTESRHRPDKFRFVDFARRSH